MALAEEQSLLQLFEQIVPTGGWRDLQGCGSQAQIFTLPVVVGMMLMQRLQERGTQQEAVHQMVSGGLQRLLPDCKRVRDGNISPRTGGYARACGRLSIEVLEKVCDQMLAELGKRIEPEPEVGVPVLLFDGTSLTLEHRDELLQHFPVGRNQHGEAHWGILKLVAFHDVQTGIALRPAWGPMYGPDAVSEQQLAEQALKQAPAGSVIIGDGNFGIFSLAHAVAESKRQVLFRLTQRRAQAMGAGNLQNGEQRLCWRPTRQDRRKHPELPPDAHVEGRLIVATQKGFRQGLYLFTTLHESAESVIALYAKRWHMELDLRALKRNLHLHHLRGKSRAAVEKELLIAVVAYGLVRAFMAQAARRVAVPPRQLSFTCAYGLLNAMVAKLCSDAAEQREQALDRILVLLGKSILPRRSQPRAYPREVWGFRQSFPSKSPSKESQM